MDGRDAHPRRRKHLQEVEMYERFLTMLSRAYTLELSDLRRQEGQTVTEYGIVLAFVAIALVAVLVTLKTGITTFIGKVNTAISVLPGF
jgi:Flp pilus assembly pilin Flp